MRKQTKINAIIFFAIIVIISVLNFVVVYGTDYRKFLKVYGGENKLCGARVQVLIFTYRCVWTNW